MRYAFSNVFEDPFWLTTVPMALVGWIVALVGSILNNVSYSSQFPVFSWWGVAFEMVAILLTLHAAFSNEIRMYRQAILACLAIATVYTTNSTNNFVWRDNSSSGAAAAGNILLSIINIVWILYFGTTQDEPVHTYIDSFAAYKKMGPPSELQRRHREKRRPATTASGAPGWPPAGLGTPSQPYRMSDVLQNIRIGDPTNFNRQTDQTDPANSRPAGSERSPAGSAQLGRAPSNPLSSTYLYSVDQLHRHGLASHEVEEPAEPGAQRLSMGTVLPDDEDEALEAMHPVARARARFSYDARTSDGEIPFRAGEILDVCDMTGNWWYCRRDTGEIGICPRNYLDLLDEPLL